MRYTRNVHIFVQKLSNAVRYGLPDLTKVENVNVHSDMYNLFNSYMYTKFHICIQNIRYTCNR